MQILADSQIAHVTEFFSDCGELRVYESGTLRPADLATADVLLVRSSTRVDDALLRDSRVSFVATATSGIEHVDSGYLRRRGIGFAHARGSNARAVAEYVLSSLFVLAGRHNFRLRDKLVGIIGHGTVGSMLASMLNVIGVTTLINDPPLRDRFGDNSGVRYHDLAEVLSADIVSLHVPLTEDGTYPTRGMVDGDFLAQFGDGDILLNTSRGGVVDQAALKACLAGRRVLTVLDVWDNEPVPDLLPGTAIGTPHIAGYSREARVLAARMIFESLCAAFNLPMEAPVLPVLPVADLDLQDKHWHDDEEAIRTAVLFAYDVSNDSTLLGPLASLPADQRGRRFNELRLDYRLRREFCGTRVHGCTDGLKVKLRQLGFLTGGA